MKPFKKFRLGLFARLMLAFLVVVLVGGIMALWLTRQATATEFTVFTTNSGRRQAESLAPVLADFYAAQGSWTGVETLLATDTPRWAA